MMRDRRIPRLLFFLLMVGATAIPCVHGQNEVALGVDLTADDAESPATDAAPWLSAGLSFAGYPTDSVSWFVDGAGRGEFATRSRTATASGTILATGTLRRGLGTLRVDVEGAGRAATASEAGSLSGNVSLFASTGNARYSMYGETSGGARSDAAGATWSTSGLLGGSVTLGNRVAPDAAIYGTYSRLPDGEWRSRLGADVTVPWYPPAPAIVSLGISGYRGLGNTRYAVDNDWYYPDRYWELAWNGELAYSLTRSITAELLLPGSLRWYLHGPVVDGAMESGRERVTTLRPELSLRWELGRGFATRVDFGGDLIWSNSPSLDNLRGYLTTSIRYGF
jgi:hypothetical protein